MAAIHSIESSFFENNWQGLYVLLKKEFEDYSTHIMPLMQKNKLEIFQIIEKLKEKTKEIELKTEEFQKQKIMKKHIISFIENTEVKICLFKGNDETIKIFTFDNCPHSVNKEEFKLDNSSAANQIFVSSEHSNHYYTIEKFFCL